LDYYKDERDIEAVITGFEQCTTEKDKFTHLSHLTVAVYYLRQSTPDEAFQRMRSGLFRFLDYHRVARGKYKEELTRNWIAIIQRVLEELKADDSLLMVTNTVLERLGDSRIITEVRSQRSEVGGQKSESSDS
jgi:cell division FtsZ-interacting protein ZapD